MYRFRQNYLLHSTEAQKSYIHFFDAHPFARYSSEPQQLHRPYESFISSVSRINFICDNTSFMRFCFSLRKFCFRWSSSFMNSTQSGCITHWPLCVVASEMYCVTLHRGQDAIASTTAFALIASSFCFALRSLCNSNASFRAWCLASRRLRSSCCIRSSCALISLR